VIPAAHITHWAAGAPWPTRQQVEQDLILSRLIIEFARHPLLGDALAFRGGTCLHKLHLPTALRYSEDLDYVRTTTGPVGDIVDAIRDTTSRIGLDERSRKIKHGMATYVCRGDAEDGGTIRIKVETNVEEVTPHLDRVKMPHTVASPWFDGHADINTFALDELMATKLRALYQRRKGRDLFDLWHTLVALDTDDVRIVSGLHHYMGDDAFTFPQLAQNLKAKLGDPDFTGDLLGLITEVPEGYALDAAADLVIERLGSRLRNAPSDEQITSGAWRS
jgi:predicted nucleotidyltransferase component of viral defense system